MAGKTQKIRVLYSYGDEKRYIGSTAMKIVTALWQGHIDFTESKNVDEWMKHASCHNPNLKGRTTEERCENYLKNFVAKGYGILITKGSSLDKKLNIRRLRGNP